MNNKKPVVYLPGLPSLSSDDINLYTDIHSARIDLVQQLAANHFHVGDIDTDHPWLKTMLQHAERSDAFMFPPMTSLPQNHPRFKSEAAQRWFEFFSLVTGVHVGSKEKYLAGGISKPCVVMDPDGQWSSVVDLLKDLHDKGMFSSNVEDIVHVVRGNPDNLHDFRTLNREAVHALADVLEKNKGKSRKHVPSRFGDGHLFETLRKPGERHPFGIAVFGSATTHEDSYKHSVSSLTKMVGERGWRMVTGAGVDGCMGAADRGFEEGRVLFNKRYPHATARPAHVGVSTQAILRLEGPPAHIDQLIITHDIYDRMKVMIKGFKSQDPKQRLSDAVKVIFVTPGGTGTLHEFATLMQLATNGDIMENRKVVLLNAPSHINPQHGFWDPLIETAKKLGFNSMFEAARSPEEAIQIADREYQKWLERNPSEKHLPHPVFHPDSTGK